MILFSVVVAFTGLAKPLQNQHCKTSTAKPALLNHKALLFKCEIVPGECAK
jgi:hypothetical protein